MDPVATSKDGDVIYKHRLRPEWGMAILAWQHDDKRAYQFEDGQTRIFKRAYFNLMQPVDDPTHRAARTLERLGNSDTGSRVRPDTGSRVRPPRATLEAVPIAAQIALFRELYPDGFQGPTWRETKRGQDAPTRLRRHRDPAIADITAFFTKTNLSALMKNADDGQVVAQLVSVLEATDLVKHAHLEPLTGLSPTRQVRLVTAIYELLFNRKPFPIRFERWITELEGSLGKTPSWPMSTAFLALARPAKYICVHLPTLRRQAATMAPRMVGEKIVSASLYERWNAMADAVAGELTAAGLSPQDRFDLYDFMVETLRPKHKNKALTL